MIYKIPESMAANTIVDVNVWHELWLDTPVSAPRPREIVAQYPPGVCVKHAQPGSWPFCGRIAFNDGTDAKVIAHNPDSREGMDPTKHTFFVWQGTVTEMKQLWIID